MERLIEQNPKRFSLNTSRPLQMKQKITPEVDTPFSPLLFPAVLVKMERLPFAAGAMRECFATKKLSTMGGNVFHDWKKAQVRI